MFVVQLAVMQFEGATKEMGTILHNNAYRWASVRPEPKKTSSSFFWRRTNDERRAPSTLQANSFTSQSFLTDLLPQNPTNQCLHKVLLFSIFKARVIDSKEEIYKRKTLNIYKTMK